MKKRRTKKKATKKLAGKGGAHAQAVKPVVHPAIKKVLGVEPDTDDAELLREWKKRTSTLCKPCWELHYCPYGPVVSDFPILPPLREGKEEHNEYLRSLLRTGRFPDGRRVDDQR